MTIVLPTLGQELGNTGSQIGQAIGALNGNNNAQALQEALLSGRIKMQDLIDMGPQLIEKKFGKGTAKFSLGDRSAAPLVNKMSAAEVQRIMQLPDNDPEKQAFIASHVGTDTPTEKAVNATKSATAGYTLAELKRIMSLPEDAPEKIEFKAKLSGTQTPAQRKQEGQQTEMNDVNITKGKQEVETAAQKTEREATNRRISHEAIMRIGGKGNLYMAYRNNTLKPEELAALQSDDEYHRLFESQRSDYWNEQENSLRNRALDEKGIVNKAKLVQDYNVHNASKIADQSNMSNVQDILKVLNNHEIEKIWAGKPAPETPEAKREWEAVQAVVNSRKMESDASKQQALAFFQKQTAGIIGSLRSPDKSGLSENEMLGQVDMYNKLANALLGGYLPPEQIPELARDKEGPRKANTILGVRIPWDKTTTYFKKGFDESLLGPGSDVAVSDPLASWRGKSKAEIDKALANVADTNARNDFKAQLLKAGIYK